MLTREQVIEHIESGQLESRCDGMNFHRLCAFFPSTDWGPLGYALPVGRVHLPKALTKENVVEELRYLVGHGFSHALAKNGMSSSIIYHSILMWQHVMEVRSKAEYKYFGLPLLKEVAFRYGFEDPLGEDQGNEEKYK